jgi:hypothetical protein
LPQPPALKRFKFLVEQLPISASTRPAVSATEEVQQTTSATSRSAATQTMAYSARGSLGAMAQKAASIVDIGHVGSSALRSIRRENFLCLRGPHKFTTGKRN